MSELVVFAFGTETGATVLYDCPVVLAHRLRILHAPDHGLTGYFHRVVSREQFSVILCRQQNRLVSGQQAEQRGYPPRRLGAF